MPEEVQVYRQSDLEFEITFYTGVLKRDPTWAEAWRLLSDNHMLLGQFDLAAICEQQMVALDPNNFMTYYSLGACLSMNERYDEAVWALTTALEMGYKNFEWLANDPYLDGLRGDDSFRPLRKLLKHISKA